MNHLFKKFEQFIQEKEAYPIYVGIFLDKSNRSKLLKEVPADYEIVTADHVTLMFKDFSNWPKLGYKMGQTVTITVTGQASDDGVQAVTVDANSNNNNPHITISHSKDRKAFQSNALLQRFTPEKMRLKLKGRVGVYMSDGSISYSEDI